MHIKYVHTNLIAKDWKKLAGFYTEVFGCSFVPPERDYQGDALDAGTGLKGAHLSGVHLRLPGYDENGPTLELYSYDHLESHLEPRFRPHPAQGSGSMWQQSADPIYSRIFRQGTGCSRPRPGTLDVSPHECPSAPCESATLIF